MKSSTYVSASSSSTNSSQVDIVAASKTSNRDHIDELQGSDNSCAECGDPFSEIHGRVTTSSHCFTVMLPTHNSVLILRRQTYTQRSANTELSNGAKHGILQSHVASL